MSEYFKDECSCLLCASDAYAVYCEVGFYVDETYRNIPVRYVQCKNCGLVYMRPQIKEQYLFSHMSHASYTHIKKADMCRDKRSVFFEALIKKIENRTSSKEALLDIGCSYGHFLKTAHIRGWDVKGVEIVQKCCAYARTTYDLEVFNGQLHDAGFPSQSFDVVVMLDSLYYLYNPKETLREVFRVLKPNGMLVIRVTNRIFLTKMFLFFLSRLVSTESNRRWLSKLIGDSVVVYNNKTLTKMLTETGYEDIELLPSGKENKKGDVQIFNLLETAWDIVSRMLYIVSGKKILISSGMIVFCKKIERN